MILVLTTKRLVLKTIDESYAETVLEYYFRNKVFLNKWEPYRANDFYNIDHQAQQLIDDERNMEAGRLVRLWIFKKDDCQFARIIGTIAFSNIIGGAFLSCHLGYKLDKHEIDKGYITEALHTGLDFIFHDFGLHRVEANIIPSNIRSLRVVEKLGFYNEGLALKYLKINGKWEDHIHMVRLNDNGCI